MFSTWAAIVLYPKYFYRPGIKRSYGADKLLFLTRGAYAPQRGRQLSRSRRIAGC